MEKIPHEIERAMAGQNDEFLERLKELEAAYYLRTKLNPDECQIVMMRKVDGEQLYLEVAHIRPMKGDEALYREVVELRARVQELERQLGGGNAS